jgi:FHA domain
LARYRLRFQLQEIDLVQGETLLGRSPDCHVTIEDPLVSRRHARIVINDEGAVVEDLGSRNGVRLNGEPMRAPCSLKDRDRLRIGMQEFVFHSISVSDVRPSGKSTGFLRYCAQCHYPFPEEMPVCPNCGHEETRESEESTLSGVLADNRPNWAAQLLLELLERALAIGRWEEAEHVLRRASAAVDERLASGGEMDPAQFDQLATSTSKVAQALQAEHWVKWLVDTSAKVERVPSSDVVARLRTIPLRNRSGVCAAVETTLRCAQEQSDALTREEQNGVAALVQWRKELTQQG